MAGARVRVSKCSWVLILMMLLCCVSMGGVVGVGAPTPSSSTTMDCSSAILGLADCLPFVEEGSKVGKPQKSCCSGLKDVVKKDVRCLCDAFNQSATLGLSINTTKALTLPSACGVSTPPFSKCNIAVAGVPAAAPAPAVGAPAYSPSSAGQTGVPALSPVHSGSSAVSFRASSAALLISLGLAVYPYYYL